MKEGNSLPECSIERLKQFGFVDLKRPTLSKLQSCLGRSSFTEDYQTIDKRILTLYPIGWSKDYSDGFQLNMFEKSADHDRIYEFIFSLQDHRTVGFVVENLNKIMTPARFLLGAVNTPIKVPIVMEEVALGGRLVPRLELDLSRPNLTKKSKR